MLHPHPAVPTSLMPSGIARFFIPHTMGRGVRVRASSKMIGNPDGFTTAELVEACGIVLANSTRWDARNEAKLLLRAIGGL